MQRRKLLKLAGASSALSAAPVVTAVEADPLDELKQTVKRASEIREKANKSIRKNDSRRELNRWLEDQPVSAGFQQYELPVSLGSTPDDIEVEKIKEGSIIIDMSLYSSLRAPYYSAALNFYYDLELSSWTAPYGCGTDKISYGENPKDAAAMTWGTDRFEAISYDRFEATDGSLYVESYAPFKTSNINVNTGVIGYRINDYQASADWIDIDEPDVFCEDGSQQVYGGQASLYLKSKGNFNPSERVVKGGYDHVYDASSPQVGASLSIPPSAGVTLSGANENIKERKVTRDRNGNEIAVTEAELDS
jgi:hypothetical protein